MAFWPMNWRKAAIISLTAVGVAVVIDDVLLVGALRLLGPLPGVGEGLDLGRGVFAGLFAEEDVVGSVGVKGRVEIDQVHRLVGDVVAEDVEVVAVEEGVGHGGLDSGEV